jgi:ankyrin repeat protein
LEELIILLILEVSGQLPLHFAAKEGAVDLLRAFLAIPGIEVSKKFVDNWAALHYASENGHSKVVKVLIAKGADVNLKDKNVKTPLDHAKENQDNQAVIKALGRAHCPLDHLLASNFVIRGTSFLFCNNNNNII